MRLRSSARRRNKAEAAMTAAEKRISRKMGGAWMATDCFRMKHTAEVAICYDPESFTQLSARPRWRRKVKGGVFRQRTSGTHRRRTLVFTAAESSREHIIPWISLFAPLTDPRQKCPGAQHDNKEAYTHRVQHPSPTCLSK